MSLAEAQAYSRARSGRAFVVMHGDDGIVAEDYAAGFGPDSAFDVQSVTKSLSGILLAQLVADGLVPDYDAKVSAFLPEWAGASAQKQNCSFRQIASQQSGLNAGQSESKPTYANSIAALMPLADVGRMKYGPNSYGVLGAAVNRIVQPRGFADAVDYLKQRTLTPAGIALASFDYVAPGEPHLAGGAHMTARNLALLGEYMRQQGYGQICAWLLQELTQPGPGYWAYGMSWWRTIDTESAAIGGTADPVKVIPRGGYSAAGSGNQRLFILPGRSMTVARLGRADASWNDEEFVSLLMAA